MFISIHRVSEPDAAIRVDDDVVGGVEGAGVVVIDEGGSLVRAFRFHIYQACWLVERALRAEDHAISVVCSPIGHVVPLRTSHFVTCEVRRREKFDLRYDNCFVVSCDGIRAWIRELV